MKSFLPKYQQLAQTLRQEILSGRLEAGAQLPTEEKLVQQYGYSRDTVRKAVSLLESEELIHKIQGLGSFVNAPHPNAVAFHFAESLPQPPQPLPVLAYRVLRQEILPASLEQAAMLKVSPGSPLIHIAQVKIENEQPCAYSERLLPQALCPRLASADLTRVSVHDLLLESAELPPMRAVVEIEARRLNETEAAWLALPPGTPAVWVNRMSYTAPNQPGVWYRGIFKDRYTLQIELENEPFERNP